MSAIQNVIVNKDGIFRHACAHLPEDPNHGLPDFVFDETLALCLFEYHVAEGKLQWWPAMGPAPHWTKQIAAGQTSESVITPELWGEFNAWIKQTYY